MEDYRQALKSAKYDFLRDNKHLGENTGLLVVGGSHCRGMATEDSDLDIRGYAYNTARNIVLGRDFEQVSDQGTDTMVYSFDKLLRLLSASNPGLLELLGCPAECYLYADDVAKELIANRKMFLSQCCIATFAGYASSQLRRLENKAQWNLFMSDLDKFPADRDYLDAADKVRVEAIEYIKSTNAYMWFNKTDMNAYAIKNKNLPTTAIYRPSNDGRVFLSVDMRKANFSALHQFDPDIFGGAETWEDFIGMFTNSDHIKRSKYIRQVVMGNCNPSRHVTLAKYYMDKILTDLDLVPYVQYFAGDEFVLSTENLQDVFDRLQNYSADVPIRISIFTLKEIQGVQGYIKEFSFHPEGRKLEIKGVSNFDIPFVARAFRGEEIQENDKVFYHEKRLAKFLEVPTVIV